MAAADNADLAGQRVAPPQVTLADVDAHRMRALEATVRSLQAHLTDQLTSASAYRDVTAQLQGQSQAERVLHAKRSSEQGKRAEELAEKIDALIAKVHDLELANGQLREKLTILEAIVADKETTS